MKDLFEKMIDHPISSMFVVAVLVDGVSILTNNLVNTFRK